MSRPIRWRLIGVRATDDEARHAAMVAAPDGQTREYVFSHDATTIGGEPAFIWHTGGWDRHTLFDVAAYKAVLDAVLAFHEAAQREIALGGTEDRKPPSGNVWRLIGIRATEDDSRYVAVVSDPEGQRREYDVVREVIDVSSGTSRWQSGDWDLHTLYAPDSHKAVIDAVNAFHEAHLREMALGDDEDRKPPGLPDL